MNPEIELLNERITLLENKLNEFILPDRYSFPRPITPIGGRAVAVTTPTAPSAGYVQAEAASAKTAIDAIRTALKNIGITL